MSERIFNILQHHALGCLNPKCNYVYTQDEIYTSKVQNYINPHKYCNSSVESYPIEYKKWNIDDVLNLEGFPGWSPGYYLRKNGFTCEGGIDLIELFDGVKWKKRREDGKTYFSRKPVNTHWNHELHKKRKQIGDTLEKLNYKEQELAIFRSARRFPGQWDDIEIFTVGEYEINKKHIRSKIKEECIKEKQRQVKIKKENEKKHKINLINWT